MSYWLLPVDDLPEAERRHGEALRDGLYALQRAIDSFGEAGALFDHLERLHTIELMQAHERASRHLFAWKGIAVRDGGFQIYHFGQVLTKDLPTSLSQTPSWSRTVDSGALKLARRLFEADFPHWRDLRDAIAHQPTMVESVDAHQFAGDDTATGVYSKAPTLMVMLRGRQLTVTSKRRLISYELAQATLDRLVAARDRTYAAYAVLARRA